MGRESEWWLAEADRSKVDLLEFPGFGTRWTSPRKPWESVKDGCPGGWYRTEFTASVRKYRRRMTEGGGHDLNPLVHAGTHWLVLEAIAYLESCESHARSEYMTVLEAKRKA